MSWQDELRTAIASIPIALDEMRAEVAVGLGQFHNGLRLTGARAVQVGDGGRTLACAGSGRLVGWSLEATGGPVHVELRDGRDESGDLLAVVDLTAETSTTQWSGPGGVSFVEGLYLVITSTGVGRLRGAVWLGAVD